MTLTFLVACTEVLAPTIPSEETYENGSNSPALYYTDSDEKVAAGEGNTNISDADSDMNYDANSYAEHNTDENAYVNGGDLAISNTDDGQHELVAPVPPANNSIRATRIRSTSTKIALTFDDGPAPYTDRILDVLEQYNSKATFFVVGSRIRAYPEIVKRAFESGHEVANHSWSHPSFPRVNDARIQSELQRTCDAIIELLGFSPPFFRPPYGATNNRVVDVAGEMGYAIIKWTLDPKDWRYRNANTIYHSVMSRVEGGSVILLHDIHPTTAEAAELLIPSLVAQGFELVTVTELLTYLYGELTPGRIYGMQVIPE